MLLAQPALVVGFADDEGPVLAHELQVELAEGVRVRIIKQTITDIITRGESVRGGKEAEEDDKPMLPTKAAAAEPAERKSLLGSLFGKK